MIHAEALFANGLHDEARTSIEAAHERLESRAKKIADPTLRESFLTRVPENARTIALAKAWLPQRARR